MEKVNVETNKEVPKEKVNVTKTISPISPKPPKPIDFLNSTTEDSIVLDSTLSKDFKLKVPKEIVSFLNLSGGLQAEWTLYKKDKCVCIKFYRLVRRSI